jgi:hypothetical protein
VDVVVPPEIAAFIAARVAGYPDEASDRLRWAAPSVAEFGALPLYLGWTETLGIRPDGAVVRWSTEGEYAGVRPVADRTWLLTALVEGARRYPELVALLPERTPGATDCACRNHPLVTSGKVLCGECGGIGWLPPGGATG